jgi:predicted ATPase/DNA-binding SARP family transcriptional activator
LIDGLWGNDPPSTAAKIVQGYVSRLRKLLPGGVLQTRPHGYQLRISSDETDLGMFERLRREADVAAKSGRLENAAGLLQEALALWRGPALADVARELQLQGELTRLDELRLTTFEERIDAELALGFHARLVPELEALTADQPFRERLRGQLMLALYRSGRQADALNAFHGWRRLLVDELGLEPSRNLQELQRQILARDPALDFVPTGAPAAPEAEPSPARSVAETPERSASVARRKIVSVLCCDLGESTANAGDRDPESLRLGLDRALPKLQAVIARHGGGDESFDGHRLTVVFGVPAIREDDALRALRAALEGRERLAGFGLEARFGVATGEIVLGGRDRPATGTPIQIAFALTRAHPHAAVVLDEATYRLTHDAVTVEAVDPLVWAGTSIRAWRVLAVARVRRERPPDSPFVGRERELAELARVLARTSSERSCELVTVVGPPGSGKSRLAREFLRGADAVVVVGRCLPYGEAMTYAPVLEIVNQLRALCANLEPDVAGPLDVLSGADGATSGDEVAWAVRKLLERAADARPLVVLLDDLQWAEEPLFALVEHTALLSTGSPIMLLCLARPELLERRPRWNATLPLDPLEDDEVGRLIDSRLEPNPDPVPADARRQLVSSAGGNPLFAEELATSFLASGGPDFTVPPTLQALLAMRLDELDESERLVLEAAAVEGEVFHASVPAAIDAKRPELAARLADLVRKGLIRPERTPRESGDDRFRFRHLLLRDAAYASASKAHRAELHERLADWFKQRPASHAERDETIGYHLEQAYRYHAELTPGTERARTLAHRAADELAAAGRHALTRADVGAAANLLQRALALDERADRSVELELNLAEALYTNGRFDEATRVLDRAGECAARVGDRGGELSVTLIRTSHELATSPEGVVERLERLSNEALELFGRERADLGLARAWFARGLVFHMRCQHVSRNEAFERAQACATRAGDTVRARSVEALLALGHLYGATPVGQALAWLDEHPRLDREPTVIGVRAVLVAMAGRTREARKLCEHAAERSRELGARYERGSFFAEVYVELLEGEVAAAAEHLRAYCAMLAEMGERNVLSTQAGHLAQALCAMGQFDEAEEWAGQARELGAEDDVMTQMIWRQARGRLLAHRGEIEAGLRLVREAIELAERTDGLNAHADALLDLSEVLELAGEPELARSATEEAVSLYKRKGNTVMSARARLRLPADPLADAHQSASRTS